MVIYCIEEPCRYLTCCSVQISVLMPVLWLIAFGFSYPQTYWKELDTLPAWQYVVNNWNVKLSEWVGEYL